MSYLFDTDVLIDYLRGHPEAVVAVESRIAEAALSTITVAEIYQGVRDSERERVGQTLSCFSILPITGDVAEKGGVLRRDQRRQGAGLADCLIAATAEIYGLTLFTLNAKHYPMLGDVEVPYTKP